MQTYRIFTERSKDGRSLGITETVIESAREPKKGETRQLLSDPPITETIVSVQLLEGEQLTELFEIEGIDNDCLGIFRVPVIHSAKFQQLFDQAYQYSRTLDPWKEVDPEPGEDKHDPMAIIEEYLLKYGIHRMPIKKIYATHL